MTEREMQELLWNHPDKLLDMPLSKFKWEASSSVGRADLVFNDRLGRFLIVEVKKGKLPRGAIDQLVDYFGMLKRQFPDNPVELMVVANQIPEERRLACEKYDIEPREIPEKRFRDVAEEVGYKFTSESAESPGIRSIETEPRSAAVRSRPLRTFGPFDLGQFGYALKTNFDRTELRRLLAEFVGVRKRDQDRSLAVRLEEELLVQNPPRLQKVTFLQLARWCKTNNPLYWDGMEVARKISFLLFGQVIDRAKLNT